MQAKIAKGVAEAWRMMLSGRSSMTAMMSSMKQSLYPIDSAGTCTSSGRPLAGASVEFFYFVWGTVGWSGLCRDDGSQSLQAGNSSARSVTISEKEQNAGGLGLPPKDSRRNM